MFLGGIPACAGTGYALRGTVDKFGCREDLQKHQLLVGHCRLLVRDALLGGSARFGKQPSRLIMERWRMIRQLKARAVSQDDLRSTGRSAVFPRKRGIMMMLC